MPSKRPIVNFARVKKDTLYSSPLELDGAKLVQRQLWLFQHDFDFRKNFVDFKRARDLYEAKTSDSNEKGIPRRNLIRGAIDDHHAVAIQNIPRVRMRADRGNMGLYDDVLRQSILGEVQRITEETLNLYIQSVLREAHFVDFRDAVLKHAAIYGVGYLMADVDRSADTRKSLELRNLLNKAPVPVYDEQGNEIEPGWTDHEASLYDVLTKRISVRHISTKDVYWQEGINRVDDRMTRVSYVERFDTAHLRRIHDNDKILPTTTLPTETWDEERYTDNLTYVLTMYEQVPYDFSRVFMDDNDEEVVSVGATDWLLVKTVIAGGQLLEKEVFTTMKDSPFGTYGSIQLPIIPFYLQESEEHPYGWSKALQLELSEEFINRMYFIMYKAARKAVANQGIIVNMAALGKGDLEKINTVLDEGGVVPIRGANWLSQDMDLRRIVQPLNYVQSQLPSAMVDATAREESHFQQQSGALNEAALSRSRSGAGKRAQIAANDRPKTITINLMARALRSFYDLVYDLIQTNHTEYVTVSVNVPGLGRKMISLNEEMERVLPVFDEFGNVETDESYVEPMNPDGVVLEPFRFTINSTAVSMEAYTDNYGDLPSDMISRFQILAALQSAQAITATTLRDLTLSDEIRQIDDVNRLKEQEEAERMMQKRAQQQAQLAQAGLLPGQGETDESGGAAFPELEQAGAQDSLLQDATNPVNAGAQDLLNQRSL